MTALAVPTLRTERLLLRALDIEADAPDVLEWYKLDSTMRYMRSVPQTTLSGVKTALSDRQTGSRALNWAITVPLPSTALQESLSTATHPPSEPSSPSRRTHRVIGVIGCRAFPAIGYTLHPAWHNRGFATEALRAVVAALWDIMPPAPELGDGSVPREPRNFRALVGANAAGFDYALALADTENAASIAVLRKAGFVKVGNVWKEYRNSIIGERDSVVFVCVRPGRELPRWVANGNGMLEMTGQELIG